jgi:DedD protein
MAFFKFRAHGQKGDEQPASPAETIDGMRRRARHRLIGAALLVLVGVVGFPLLFDTQPRPIQVDIPIEIPDKTKAKPASTAGKVSDAPAAAATPPVAQVAPVAPVAPPKPAANEAQGKVAANASLDAKEEVVASKPAAAPAPVAKPEPKVEAKAAEPKPEPKAVAKSDDGTKAKALLDGKDVAAADARFVVQIGAFADAAKAREARMKVERAGLKTYMQEVDTKDGKRIRVRVGPYAQRAEADKVAGKIKSLDLPASILSL